MKDSYLCTTPEARTLYRKIRHLPIYDYHCHLSPQEILEDKPFDNIGQLWLGGDHYKWRLMRQYGIAEEYITGGRNWHDKFLQYAKVICMAAGNPLYQWTQMELSLYFDIETPLTPETAESIWTQANKVIAQKKLSARKLISASNVTYIATTDDVLSDLDYHRKLKEDTGFNVTVVPSFRTDNLLMLTRPGYPEYIRRLSQLCGTPIQNLQELKQAVCMRLDYFVEQGCKFTDVGIPAFPSFIASQKDADAAFCAAAAGQPVTENALDGFLGHMFVFLGREYQKRNLVMQWHLAVFRNVNSKLFESLGADTGIDCVGDPIPGKDLIAVLDAIERGGGLPKTILYSLNPSDNAQLISIAGSFSGVRCGAAWWFCDHKRGILDLLELIASEGHLGTFPGMLTDSRSFLSYARHDYFRRLVCDLLGRWQRNKEITSYTALRVALALCGENTRDLIEEETT